MFANRGCAAADEVASSYTFLMERTSGRFVACSRCEEIVEVDSDIKLVRLANSSEVEQVQQTVQYLDGLETPIQVSVTCLFLDVIYIVSAQVPLTLLT